MNKSPEKATQGCKKPSTRISVSQTIKALFLILTLIVAFLFALNGRYMMIDDEYYFDKWTKTMLWIESEKIIK